MKKIIVNILFATTFITQVFSQFSNTSTEDLKRLSKIEAIAEGQLLPEICLPNIKGDSISLSTFRGKHIYINFWATWCAPCIKHMPFHDSLAKSLSGKDIIMVYISIDADVNKAIKYTKDHKLPGIQLFAGGSVNQPVSYFIYRVRWLENDKRDMDNGIPRYILVNDQGKIINNRVETYSNEGIKEVVNKALVIKE